MAGGPINPDPEQQEADNRASRRQSHIGPLPPEFEDGQDEASETSGTDTAGSDETDEGNDRESA